MVWFISRSSSSLVAWWMYLQSPTLPYSATIIALTLLLAVTFFMHNPKQHLSEHKDTTSHINAISDLVRKEKWIMTLLFMVAVLFPIVGEAYFYSYQTYLKEIDFGVSEVSIIFFVLSLASALGSHLSIRIEKLLWWAFKSVLLMIILLFLTSLLFLTFSKIWGVFSVFFLSFLFGLVDPITNRYLIKQSPKTHKTTVFSLFWFMYSFGVIVAWVGISALLVFTDIEWAYRVLAIVVFFSVLLSILTYKFKVKSLENS